MRTFLPSYPKTLFMAPVRAMTYLSVIFFCCLASMTSVMSQTFSISPSNTITDTADCGTNPYVSTVFIFNPGSTDLYLSYTVVSNTLPGDSCWEYTFCDWTQCGIGLPTGTITPDTLQPIPANSQSSSMIFDITPNNNKGQGSFVIALFETKNPSNSVTVTWNISGCPTGTECASGISETANHTDFIVFPNPAEDFINVEITNSYKPGSSIHVYNMMGEKFIEYAGIKNNTLKMDLTKLPAGGYFIKYNNGENTSVKKFFKIK